LASGPEFLREPHGGAKRAKHRAKRSPECGDPVGGRVNASSNCFMFYFKKGVSLRKKSYGKEQRDR
jgi:hypothetical protein